ncbi:hypothetical protein [Streptomyces sp. NPDC058701]|uniref:hypothetical protein n=1 Tax=Streptomyces sp. NPDC058701 TaxID=3346608 RepID=UPI00364FEC29
MCAQIFRRERARGALRARRRANRIRLAGTGTTPPRPLFVEHDLKADKNCVGPHDQHTRDVVMALLPASPLWPTRKYRGCVDHGVRLLGFVGLILDRLKAHPGDGWQARWQVAGADQSKEIVHAGVLGDDQWKSQRKGVISGMNLQMSHRIVLPGYGFLRGYGRAVLQERPAALPRRQAGADAPLRGRHRHDGPSHRRRHASGRVDHSAHRP